VPGAPLLNAAWLDDTRLAVAGELGAIATSTDGGATWTTGHTGLAVSLRGLRLTEAGGDSWAVGEDGTFLHSDDAGASWTRRPPATTQALRGLFAGEDGQIWVVGSAQTVLHSDDGHAWSPRSALLSGLYAVVFPAGGRVGVAVGDDGTVLKTEDIGDTWTSRTSRTDETLFDVSFDASGMNGVAVGSGGALIRTETGGDTWKSLDVDMDANFYATLVAPTKDGAKVYVAGERGALYVADSTKLESLALAPVPYAEDLRGLALAGGADVVAVGGRFEDPGAVCEEGYVLRPGVTPRSHWKYLLLVLGVGAFGLYSLVNLIRNIRRLLQ